MNPKGAVACGHPQTAKAAAQILNQGGNAFDAVIAAHFAACISEPILSSLGGGGFLTIHTAEGSNVVYDFFAHTPGTKQALADIDFYPITADFGETTQEFHIGMGSIAVPGSIRGLFEIHRDLGSLPMSVLVEPAVELAMNGVEVNAFQAYILDIIKPIYQHDKTCFQTFKSLIPNSDKQLLQQGEVFKTPDLANFLEALAREGDRLFYEGDVASSIVSACRENGGLLSSNDLKNYQVIKRKPLSLNYRNSRILTNPPPSSGGILIAFALALLQSIKFEDMHNLSASYFQLLKQVMKTTNNARATAQSVHPYALGPHMLDNQFIERYQKEVAKHFAFNRGTTQISIIDSSNNIASLTTSNGEGSSFIAPGTGVILNNMLGEEDLNPGGFNQWQENQRISSMMAPTILFDPQGNACSIGSGGSNRIRSAILQVLIQLIDFHQDLHSAIEAPRIHYENQLVNLEEGALIKDQPFELDENEMLKLWKEKNLFFGGVHAVRSVDNKFEGKGDPRRGGVSIIV